MVSLTWMIRCWTRRRWRCQEQNPEIYGSLITVWDNKELHSFVQWGLFNVCLTSLLDWNAIHSQKLFPVDTECHLSLELDSVRDVSVGRNRTWQLNSSTPPFFSLSPLWDLCLVWKFICLLDCTSAGDFGGWSGYLCSVTQVASETNQATTAYLGFFFFIID